MNGSKFFVCIYVECEVDSIGALARLLVFTESAIMYVSAMMSFL